MKKRGNFWTKLGYVALIVGILGGLAEFLNFINIIPTNHNGGMQLTVYIQDIDGKPIKKLQNKGKLIVDFGNDRRDPLIGENGRTNLGEIPKIFRGEQIPIILEAEGYEVVTDKKKFLMDGNPIYLSVQRDKSLGLIQGVVKNSSGELFINKAMIMIDLDTTTLTDSLGRFRLLMPVERQRDTYSLTVKKEGYKAANDYYKPNAGLKEIRLTELQTQ